MMRSFGRILNLIVVIAYTIYQSVDECSFYCEIGIAVATAIIQVIIDHKMPGLISIG